MDIGHRNVMIQQLYIQSWITTYTKDFELADHSAITYCAEGMANHQIQYAIGNNMMFIDGSYS